MSEYKSIESYIYDEVLCGIEDLLDVAVDKLEVENSDTKDRIWKYIEVDIKQKINEKRK